MPFHLITGIPGHGKTSLAMELLLQAVQANNAAIKSGRPILADEDGNAIFLNPDGSPMLHRPIYAAGIDGLEPGLAEPLDDPTQWEKLPHGSLIFLDEVWKWFGHLQDARGKPPPLHVQGIAEHRHMGLDFVATSQGPNQIYPFVRPLIGPHWHVVRRFGSPLIDVYKWGELVEEVQSQGMRDRGVKETRTLPTAGRKHYKSASAHTIKMRFPLKMIVGIAAFVVVPIVGYFAFQALRPSAITAGITGAPEPDLSGDGAKLEEGPRSKAAGLSVEEYAKLLTPRIAGVHGSQPIFDGRSVQAIPQQLCFITGEPPATRCRCVTEQLTPVKDVQDEVCRDWALFGRYDPYKAPPDGAAPVMKREAEKKQEADGPRSVIAQGDPTQVGAGPAAAAVRGHL